MRHYAGSALLLFITTAVIVGSYTVNLKVSAERAQVQRLQRTLVADARGIRDLQAELRTRARLPEMQRWNDNVLLMAAPAAGQYLRSPVQLAGFAVPEAPVQPVQRAVTAPVAIAPPTITAPIIRAAWRPTVRETQPRSLAQSRALSQAQPQAQSQSQPVARVINAAYRPAAARTAPLVILPEMAPPAAGAPIDLLHDGGQ